MKGMNIRRIRRLIRDAIQFTRLDLSGLNVLTEAATGYYALTPVIAVLAGADRVTAFARDTRFGTADSVAAFAESLADEFDAGHRIEFLTEKLDASVARADIVTNLGMLRPLDSAILGLLKPTAVIPLMWETWEFRPADLDLAECNRLGICVLGTDEHRPELSIFQYVGHLALKLLFEAGVEVFRSRVAVLGSGEFASLAVESLTGAGAEALLISTTDPGWPFALLASGRSLDALCIFEHHSSSPLIGPDAPVTPADLAGVFPELSVIHVCGNADRAGLTDAGIPCTPSRFAPAGSMSVATDYLGPRPVVDLHTAGLRVGEVMARCRLDGLDRQQAERRTLEMEPLAQAFI